jgi:prophage regulatory protein
MFILRLPGVKGKMGHRADASVYNAIRDGLMTTGVAIGQRAKGWPDYEIDAINAARIAGQSEDQIRELVKRLHAQRTGLLATTGAQA